MKSEVIKLLDILSVSYTNISNPPYHRNYVWTERQCDALINAVINTAENNMSGHTREYYMGSIVYVQRGSSSNRCVKLDLVDGFQRIMTSMLLLAAIRNYVDDDQRRAIDNMYLFRDGVTGDDAGAKSKVKPLGEDRNVYRKIILAEPMTTVEKDSLVYRNYQYICDKIGRYQEEGADVSMLISEGLARLSVVSIELQPHVHNGEEPQKVYDDLNSY